MLRQPSGLQRALFVAVALLGVSCAAERVRPDRSLRGTDLHRATAGSAADGNAHSRDDATPRDESAETERLRNAVDALIAEASFPSAAVLLDSQGRLLAASGAGPGADPARTALRPGSTVKPLLAQIAARRGSLRPGDSWVCEGDYAPVPGFHCFDTHGKLDLSQALRVSCNDYFYEVARRTGFDTIRAGLLTYGLGSKTGLFAEESAGELPQSATLEAARPAADGSGPWEGFALLVGTGHGPIQVTLAQLTRAYSQLARELTSDEETSDSSTERLAVKRELLRGLVAVTEDGGTGHLAHVDGLTVAGKTGTAEPGHFTDPDSEKETPNGWFVGFAPAENPQVVLGVLAVGGSSAGTSAAPLAGQLFRAWRDLRPDSSSAGST